MKKQFCDKDIMFSIGAGEIDKAALLFDKYNVRLYSFFMKMTNNPDLSKDLVQDVFLRLIKYRGS